MHLPRPVLAVLIVLALAVTSAATSASVAAGATPSPGASSGPGSEPSPSPSMSPSPSPSPTATRAPRPASTAPPGPPAPPVPSGPSERWTADVPYIGTFPDPDVLVDAGRYVASGTTVASLNLPVMTSPDLRTWTPRPPLPDALQHSTWRLYNDAMVVKPAWAATVRVRDQVPLMSQWAPSIVKLRGRYVAAFSAAVTLTPRKSCIGLATSASVTGPYVPTSAAPLVCYDPSLLGAIDPDFFVDPRTGAPWLLWKNEGRVGKHGPRLMARRLTASGTAFAPRSKARTLMTTTQRWEGAVVENPSMVHYRGRYYLLYSGNGWETGSYAIGHAVCRGPAGPCRKPVRGPLLTSGGGVQGPGGADAFVDLQGRLRFAYAAWDAGRVGDPHPRRLYVGTLSPVQKGKRLVVTSR